MLPTTCTIKACNVRGLTVVALRGQASQKLDTLQQCFSLFFCIDEYAAIPLAEGAKFVLCSKRESLLNVSKYKVAFVRQNDFLK